MTFGNVQQNFAVSNAALFIAALKWWEMHRPCSYTLEEHLANPEINIPEEEGKKLGIEIALILRTEVME